MTGDVDYVVDAAKDPITAISGEDRAVSGVIRPVAPVLALRILVVLLVVLIDESLRAAPDGLHNPGPRVAYANISSGAGACAHFLSFFIPNNRIDAERGRSGAAGLHGIQRGLSGAKEASRFGLPPSIDDHRFLFANHVVIPSPDFRFDRFADRGHVLEVVVVFPGFVAACFAQHTNRGARSMEDVYIQSFGNAPRTAGIGKLRHAFV